MLRADYTKLDVASFVLRLAVVVFITMDLMGSLNKEFKVVVFAGTFGATSTEKMVIGYLPEISVLRAGNTDLCSGINVVCLLVCVLIVVDLICFLNELLSR